MTKIVSHVHVVPTPILIGISVLEVVDMYDIYLGQIIKFNELILIFFRNR